MGPASAALDRARPVAVTRSYGEARPDGGGEPLHPPLKAVDNGEYGGIPQIKNNVFTTSLLLIN